jgi:hypothetical protein
VHLLLDFQRLYPRRASGPSTSRQRGNQAPRVPAGVLSCPGQAPWTLGVGEGVELEGWPEVVWLRRADHGAGGVGRARPLTSRREGLRATIEEVGS